MGEVQEYQENYGDGWISLYRSIRKHWLWKDPQKFKWWVDILLEVNHHGQKVNINYKLYECQRGETILSLRSWAKRWMTTHKTVKKFFKLLESDKMITTRSIGVSTHLTVCNYESYQNQVSTVDYTVDPQRYPQGNQTVPTNNNVNNVNKEKKYTSPSGEERTDLPKKQKEAAPAADPTTDSQIAAYRTKKGRVLKGPALIGFESFWVAFDFKQGKAEAADAWYDHVKAKTINSGNLSKVVQAAGAEAQRRPQLLADNKTPKMAQGWLSGRRWEDESLENKPKSVSL